MKCTILFGICTENINGNVTEVKECDERMMDELKEWNIAPEANATTHQQAKHYQSNNNRKNIHSLELSPNFYIQQNISEQQNNRSHNTKAQDINVNFVPEQQQEPTINKCLDSTNTQENVF